MSPEEHVALAALIRKAAKVEADLQVLQGEAPTALQLVLIKARRQAIAAMEALIDADPHDANGIMLAQNEVRAFVDLIKFSRGIMDEADERESELNMVSEEEKEIVSDMVLHPHAPADEDGEE